MTDMERKTKIILLVAGGVLVVGSITLGVYMHLKNKKDQEEESGVQDTKPNTSNGGGNTGSESEVETNQETEEQIPVDDGLIHPKWNTENELWNSYGQLKGRYLYPKRKAQGGWGYTNIRSSALVNNDTSWFWDGIDNLITTINSGTPIGKVIGVTSGVYNSYSYRWFKVKLLKPYTEYFTAYTTAYVRADTVTIKPYKK